MFDKKKCKECAYSMTLSGGKSYTKAIREKPEDNLMCGRSLILHDTCLRSQHGEIVDIRGNDPKACACYKPKKADRNGRLY